jgi:hypothetical protein
MLFAPSLCGQTYLSKERENEIKTSDKYYWDECSDFNADNARQGAFEGMKMLMIQDVVLQSIKQDEILKAIETGANFDQLQQQGKVKILAWIAKDSVFVITKKPVSPKPPPPPNPQPVAPAPKEKGTPVPTNDPVLKDLIACKTYNDVRRVATINGLVRGSRKNSSVGFSNPEKCIIAVFTTEGETLSALLDAGSSSRVDLLSGKSIQNPEQYYNKEAYFLWYMLQKNK